MNRALLLFAAAALALDNAQVFAQDTPLERECIKEDWAETRAFSPAVVTSGGRVAWLAGVTATRNAGGEDIGGNFEAQAHEVFRIINERLANLGGDLEDIVTMTVFIKDTRHGDQFVDIRKQYFQECFPSSALITVVGFARPDIMLEIKATAVLE